MSHTGSRIAVAAALLDSQLTANNDVQVFGNQGDTLSKGDPLIIFVLFDAEIEQPGTGALTGCVPTLTTDIGTLSVSCRPHAAQAQGSLLMPSTGKALRE